MAAEDNGRGRSLLPLLPVIALASLLAFFRLNAVTLFDVDEAVFAEATKEMVESGDLITPTYNGVNRFDKPILYYWAMALSYRVFGINELGARFPSALAAVLLIVSVFLFARRVSGPQRALLASVAAALSLYYAVYSRAAVTDMTLTLLICLSLFSFFLWSSGRGKKTLLYGFYLCSALAFLTKGLIGVVFPFGIAVIFLAATEGLRNTARLLDPVGVIIFLAVGLPWYAVQLTINRAEFIQLFFVKHHFARFTTSISGHGQPFWYFLPVLLVSFFPWSAYLPAGVQAALKERDRLGLFSLIWFLTVFIFFSFSRTKLPNYILPAMPAAALLASSGMTTAHAGWKRFSDLSLAFLAAVLGAGLIIGSFYAQRAGISGTGWIFAPAGMMFLLAAVAVYASVTRKSPFDLVSGIMLLFLLTLITQGLPLANSHLQGTLYRYSLMARDRLKGDGRLIVCCINQPSVVFYSGRRVIQASNMEEFRVAAAAPGRTVVIGNAREADALAAEGFRLLEKDGRYAILEKQ